MRQFIDIVESAGGVARVTSRDGRPFLLLRNASTNAILTLLYRSQHREVRGLIVEEDCYWWDGDYAIHHTVAEELGVPLVRSYRLFVELKGSSMEPVRLFSDLPRADAPPDAINHPEVRAILADGQIKLRDPEDPFSYIDMSEFLLLTSRV